MIKRWEEVTEEQKAYIVITMRTERQTLTSNVVFSMRRLYGKVKGKKNSEALPYSCFLMLVPAAIPKN